MQKVSAILFISVMLLSQTPFQQVLKLPVLVQHFLEHKQETRSIGLAEFMQLHYLSGDVRDSDYDRDQQLPFRADAMIIVSSSVVVQDCQVQLDPLPLREEQSFPLLDINSLPSRHSFDIWQPPRSC